MFGVILVVGGASAGVGRGRNSHKVGSYLWCYMSRCLYVCFYRDLNRTLSRVINSRTQQKKTVLMILVSSLRKESMKLEK